MNYRELGRTGLKLSILAYGASSLGNEFRQTDEAEGIRSLHVALDGGINFIDTSPYYGRTLSEKVLGKAFKEIPRDRFIIGTKCGRYDVEKFDFSADRVTRSVDESLQRMGLEYIDIMQCHDIEFVPMAQIVEETLPALRKLQQQGKIRFVGITGFPLKIFKYVLERTNLDCILSYCHYALNDDSLLELIPFLKEKGVGIINASPFSARLLTNAPLPKWHLASPELKDACRRAAEHCSRRGVDIAQLAVRFCVENPDITTCVVGTADPVNMQKCLDWANGPLDETLLKEVQAILAPVKNKTWIAGLPENN
ncbi:MAG: aldo/keto reductase [Verrucomicrobiota bacterium]|nr:aldo/keto reductase [Verrucomicrobiota bacterium]